MPWKRSRPRSTLALRFTPGCETDDSAEAGVSDSSGSDMLSQAVSRMPKPFNQIFLFILVCLVYLVYFVCLVRLVNQINQLISLARNRYCSDLPE